MLLNLKIFSIKLLPGVNKEQVYYPNFTFGHGTFTYMKRTVQKTNRKEEKKHHGTDQETKYQHLNSQLERDLIDDITRKTGMKRCFRYGLCLIQEERETRILYLSRANLNEKAATFVRNLQHFGPRKAVNSQLIFVNQKATRADTQDDIHSLQVLRKKSVSVSVLSKVLNIVDYYQTI